jgi:hypothetical protein
MSLPRVTESARRRREYWEEFVEALRLADPTIRVPTPNTLGNLWFNLRGRDPWVTVYAASSLGRIGVFLRGKLEYYGKILAKRRQIEAQIGARLGGIRTTITGASGLRRRPTRRIERIGRGNIDGWR